jgi:biotin synthase-related radical SAM superfamily protein
METIQIDILNPKAKKLLRNLADLNLIKINKPKSKSDFSTLLQKLRAKSTDEISLDEITNEVELVRKLRYEK